MLPTWQRMTDRAEERLWSRMTRAITGAWVAIDAAIGGSDHSVDDDERNTTDYDNSFWSVCHCFADGLRRTRVVLSLAAAIAPCRVLVAFAESLSNTQRKRLQRQLRDPGRVSEDHRCTDGRERWWQLRRWLCDRLTGDCDWVSDRLAIASLADPAARNAVSLSVRSVAWVMISK